MSASIGNDRRRRGYAAQARAGLTAAAAEEAVGNRRPAAGLLGAGAARVGERSAAPTEPERRRRGGGSCEEHAPTERLADDKGERKGHEKLCQRGAQAAESRLAMQPGIRQES
jgi:hypothetical protein